MSKKGTEIVPAEQIESIEAIAQECNLLAISDAGRFAKAITLANGIKRLQAALTGEVMSQIMPLQGSSLGFRTDKDKKGGYPIEAVRDCLIEAVLRGANPVGNEFNIIARRSYMTKEFFTRMVGEFEGLSDLKLRPGVPHIQGKSGLVPFIATWKLNGKKKSIERIKTEKEDYRIPVRVNEGQGPDAVVGKATRKMLAQIYAEVTGSTSLAPDGEVDGDEPFDVTPEGSTESVKQRVQEANEASATVPDPAPEENTSEPEDAGEGQEMTPDENGDDDTLTSEDFDRVFPQAKGQKAWNNSLTAACKGLTDRERFVVVNAVLVDFGFPSVDGVPLNMQISFVDEIKKQRKAAE